MKRGIYRFLAGLSEITELPLTEMCREFSVYVTGRREITVSGVMSVKEYENERIVLQVCGDCVRVIGADLVLKNYYHSELCIGGRVDRVEFGGD